MQTVVARSPDINGAIAASAKPPARKRRRAKAAVAAKPVEMGAQPYPRQARPLTFINDIIDAATPVVDEDGNPLSFEALARAVAPLFTGYTVADGLATLTLIRGFMDCGFVMPEERKKEALYEVSYLLEGFVCFAWATGPDCVAARAALLLRSVGRPDSSEDVGAWCLSEGQTKGVVWRLAHEVGEIESTLAETFDRCLESSCHWLANYIESRRDNDR